jgi:predicted DNA-binding protein
MASARMSFSYPDKFRNPLVSLAKNDGRTLSSYVQQILKKHLEEKGVLDEDTEKPKKPKKRPRKRKAQ